MELLLHLDFKSPRVTCLIKLEKKSNIHLGPNVLLINIFTLPVK